MHDHYDYYMPILWSDSTQEYMNKLIVAHYHKRKNKKSELLVT